MLAATGRCVCSACKKGIKSNISIQRIFFGAHSPNSLFPLALFGLFLSQLTCIHIPWGKGHTYTLCGFSQGKGDEERTTLAFGTLNPDAPTMPLH